MRCAPRHGSRHNTPQEAPTIATAQLPRLPAPADHPGAIATSAYTSVVSGHIDVQAAQHSEMIVLRQDPAPAWEWVNIPFPRRTGAVNTTRP
ncbi:hypothetical protein BCAR13_440169 [Paraburkholderia caribensis]|nr:hypothetical protein BCAR13_440169 [Paraburkholderia caribensis]